MQNLNASVDYQSRAADIHVVPAATAPVEISEAEHAGLVSLESYGLQPVKQLLVHLGNARIVQRHPLLLYGLRERAIDQIALLYGAVSFRVEGEEFLAARLDADDHRR